MSVLNFKFSFNSKMYRKIDEIATGFILTIFFISYLKNELFLGSKTPLACISYVNNIFYIKTQESLTC